MIRQLARTKKERKSRVVRDSLSDAFFSPYVFKLEKLHKPDCIDLLKQYQILRLNEKNSQRTKRYRKYYLRKITQVCVF